MTCPPTSFNWLGLLTAAVTIFGWFVVFRQSLILKSREDVRGLVDTAQSIVDEIYELSKKYYTDNDDHIGFISSDIRSRFLLLSLYVSLINKKNAKYDVEHYVIQYRKAIMGGFFETTEFKRQMEIPDRRADISNFRSELHYHIEIMFVNWTKSIKWFERLH